jgi:very-short-patch-repair endonuclease
MWLDEMNLNYNRQHSFDTCRYVNKLSFDFYLPDHNICIEFDGKQHFKSIDWFGGDKEFIKNKERDKVKDDWCVNNNVGLLRIKYNQVNKIKYILQEKLQIVDKK